VKKFFNINWNSLKVRIMLAISLGILLVFAVMVITFLYSNNIIFKRMEANLDSSADIATNFISFRAEKSKSIAQLLANSDNLDRMRRYGLNEGLRIQDYYDAMQAFTREIMYFYEVNDEVESIFVYFEEQGIFIDSYRNTYQDERLQRINWLYDVKIPDKPVTWVEFYDDSVTGKNLISFVYRGDKLNWRLSKPVYIYICYERSEFYEFLNHIKLTENAKSGIINFEDNILIYEADTDDRVEIRGRLFSEKEALVMGTYEVEVSLKDQGKAILRYWDFDFLNGGLIYVVPKKDLQPYNRSIFIYLIVTSSALLLLYLSLLYAVVVKFIDKPVQKIVSHMKKVERGEFSSRIKEKRKDEFGYVYEAYNNMVYKVERLIHELYQEKLVKKEMQLKVLQEKINPHFLYNTLDTINWIAKEHNVEDISKMVIALSTMYRKTFNRGRDLISISDILISISCYLDIQRIRYGESFSYKIDADESIMKLNLVIQTIVENSIVHGFIQKKNDGLLYIKIDREGDVLHIIVEDNGKGMSEEKLELIGLSINSDKHESESGLRNVQKRIKLYYGDEYGIKLESREDQGTRVTITIPVKEEDNDVYDDF
jgi:two-component system, sensor histidine kinase YesM